MYLVSYSPDFKYDSFVLGISFFLLATTEQAITFGVIQYIGANICALYVIMGFTNIIIMKVIYIFKFSRIAVRNEYFISRILIFAKIIIISIICTIRLTLKDYETHPGVIWRHKIPLYQIKTKTDAHHNVVM